MEEVKLGTLTNRKIGYGIVQPGASVPNGVPVIKVNNVVSGLKEIHDLDTTTPEIDSKYSRTKLVGGEIVVSVVGTVGKTAIVPESFAGCNLVRATAMIDILNPLMKYWVKYYIDSPQGQQYIQMNLNTTVQFALNIKSLVDMPIPIFSSEYMRQAVIILKSLDDKIVLNRRINENLEQQAQALFKSWFVDFDPFKDQPFVESELGMIPQGWRLGTLGEICVTNKRTYRGNFVSEIEYIDTGSVTNNIIEAPQILNPAIDKIPSRARRAVTEGDIIYSSVRPNQRHYALLLNPSSNAVVSTGFVVITSNWSGYRYFIFHFLIQDEIVNKLHAIAEQSVSTFPSINASDITSLKLVIPPNEIIGKYAELCLSYYKQIYKNQQESHHLEELRDTLIPRLMAGEFKFNDIEM